MKVLVAAGGTVKTGSVLAAAAAVLAAAAALTGCGGTASRPHHGTAAAKAAVSAKPSCAAQYGAWRAGPAKSVADQLVSRLQAGDLPGAGRYAKQLQAYPVPACADPKGYWADLLTALRQMASGGTATVLADAPEVKQLMTDFQDEVSREHLPGSAPAPVSPSAERLASELGMDHEPGYVAYNARTDPNHDLGRQGEYASKVNWGGQQDNSIEVFTGAADAAARKTYLSAFRCPFGDGYDLVTGTALLRLSCEIAPGDAHALEVRFAKLAALPGQHVTVPAAAPVSTPSTPASTPAAAGNAGQHCQTLTYQNGAPIISPGTFDSAGHCVTAPGPVHSHFTDSQAQQVKRPADSGEVQLCNVDPAQAKAQGLVCPGK